MVANKAVRETQVTEKSNISVILIGFVILIHLTANKLYPRIVTRYDSC